MQNVAVIGDHLSDDQGSSSVISSTISKMKVGGIPVVGVGSKISPHGGHVPQRSMITGSSKLKVGGIPVCITGSQADCGAVLTGTSKMKVAS